jgi:hypothetical protein
MTDYEPLDISGLCNDRADDEAMGDLSMRGLPFAIADGPRVIVPTEPVTVPVGKAARCVIFAHRQLGSHLSGGFGVGAHVADYVFRLERSDPITVPIRERFEIQVVPTPWGHTPYLAVPDRPDGLMPRWEGRFDIAGFRQCEFVPSFARSYYLWAWSSPDPDRVIESVELVPRMGRFRVAAVTLGTLTSTRSYERRKETSACSSTSLTKGVASRIWRCIRTEGSRPTSSLWRRTEAGTRAGVSRTRVVQHTWRSRRSRRLSSA